MAKDRAWLRKVLDRKLNFNKGQANQNFDSDELNDMINESYNLEVEMAKQEGNPDFFRMNETFTWPASEPEYVLEAAVVDLQHFQFFDITDGRPGYPLRVGGRENPGDFFFVDRNTLRWNTESGPSSARTIEVEYMAAAEELEADNDEPRLIAPPYRELIALSAAITARDEADEQHPATWAQRLTLLRAAFWKSLADRPKSKPSVVLSSASGGYFVEPPVT